jgi:hypothetical protein
MFSHACVRLFDVYPIALLLLISTPHRGYCGRAESLEVCFIHPVTQQVLHTSIREPQRFATLREQQRNRWRKMEALAQKEQEQAQAEAAALE